jgi:glycine/D-amino acid oxidase-like deaminating enzyme
MPGLAGLAVGNGLGAAGLTIGPFAGRLLADLVTEQEGLMDLTPFDPAGRGAADRQRSRRLRYADARAGRHCLAAPAMTKNHRTNRRKQS